MHARSRLAIRVALVAGLVAGSSQSAQAQQALAPRAPRVDVAAPAPRATGPTTDAAAVGVRQPVSKEAPTANATMQRRRGYGQPIALMVVGGAALLTGLIIGDDAGTVIAVGGAVVGLYGLYQYLQ
jgi:hypothetical protein